MNELNPEQQLAVKFRDGVCAVIAVPGRIDRTGYANNYLYGHASLVEIAVGIEGLVAESVLPLIAEEGFIGKGTVRLEAENSVVWPGDQPGGDAVAISVEVVAEHSRCRNIQGTGLINRIGIIVHRWWVVAQNGPRP